MKFTKMHGAGNDFIIINNIEENIPLDKIPAIAKKLCHRRLSLGADGFMVIDKPTDCGDFRMHFFNSDGSLGEMCGNGARCIARYGYENNLAGDIQKIETTAGLVIGNRLEKKLYKIQLNNPTTINIYSDLEIDGITYKCSYVELGTPGLPHAVVYYPCLNDTPEAELRDLARKIRFHERFPKGANVNFYDIISEDYIVEKTFERGVEDFTLACGTGSGSVALILTLLGKVSGKNITISVPGGTLYVDVVLSSDKVNELYLTGPTNIVAIGEIIDEDLQY